MKRLLFLFVGFSFFGLSQSDWTKEDRSNLYDEYISKLTQYKSISNEQRESISLCCLESTTLKYSKKDFSSKIEIEIKRIHESIIGQCAKNIGVELQSSPIESTDKPVNSVPSDWTREDKLKLAKDFENFSIKYALTSEQQDILSLCYIQETVGSIKKNDYSEMIEIELNQHKERTINQCAKQKRIELIDAKAAKKESKSVLSKEFLLSTWKTDQEFSITFNENGTFIKTFKEDYWTPRVTKIEGNVVNGEWFIDEKGTLTLKEVWVELEYKLLTTKSNPSNETSKYNFVSYSNDFFKMELIEGKNPFGTSSNGAGLIIQANRVK